MSTQLASRILSNRSYNWQSTGIWEDLVVEGAEWLAACYAEYGRVASEMRNELKGRTPGAGGPFGWQMERQEQAGSIRQNLCVSQLRVYGV